MKSENLNSSGSSHCEKISKSLKSSSLGTMGLPRTPENEEERTKAAAAAAEAEAEASRALKATKQQLEEQVDGDKEDVLHEFLSEEIPKIQQLFGPNLQGFDQFCEKLLELRGYQKKSFKTMEEKVAAILQGPQHSENPTRNLLTNSEENQEAGQIVEDDFIKMVGGTRVKFCKTVEDYKKYQERYTKLATPAKMFNSIYNEAMKDFSKKSKASKEKGLAHLKELTKYFERLAEIREFVTSSWTVQAQLADDYIEKKQVFLNKAKEAFDIKYSRGEETEDTVVPSGIHELEKETETEASGLKAIKLKKAQIALQVQFTQLEEKKRKEEKAYFDELNKLKKIENNLTAVVAEEEVPQEEEEEISRPCSSLYSGLYQLDGTTDERKVVIGGEIVSFSDEEEEEEAGGLIPNCNRRPLGGPIKKRIPVKFPAAAANTAVRAGSVLPNLQNHSNSAEMSFLLQLMAKHQFNIVEHVGSFDGKGDLRTFALWRANLEDADQKMNALGFSQKERYRKLLMCLSGTPKEMVTTTNPKDESYKNAILTLDKHYNKPGLYMKEVMHELSTLDKMSDSKESITKASIKLHTAWDNFKTSKLTEAQLTYLYFIEINEPKLSPNAQRIWNNKKWKFKDPKNPLGHTLTINDFFETIEEAKESAINKAWAQQPQCNDKTKNKKQNNTTTSSSHSTELVGAETIFPVNESDPTLCPLPGCKDKIHTYLLHCPQLKSMPSLQLFRWTKANKVTCHKCLGKSHSSKSCKLGPCKMKWDGVVCGGAHTKYLCYDRKNNKKQQNKKGFSSQQTQNKSADNDGANDSDQNVGNNNNGEQ